MRITSIAAQNFLSFDRFSLSDLDSTLNVIVGPNGSGKTNLVRILQMARDVLGSSPGRQGWVGAQRLGSQEPSFTVRISLELTEEWEKDLLSTFVCAALTSRLDNMRSKGSPIPDEVAQRYFRWTLDQLPPVALESMFKGELEVRCLGEPERLWEITYDFHHAGQRYRWVILRPGFRESTIILADVEQAPSALQSASEALLEQYYDLDKDDFVSPRLAGFDFREILPGEKRKGVIFEVGPVTGLLIPEPVRHFGKLAGVDLLQSGRFFQVSIVFERLIQRTLLFMRDLRVPPREVFPAEDLTRPLSSIDPGDGADLPLYLFRLKNGARGEREAYDKIGKLFWALTDRRFDIHAEITPKRQEQQEQVGVLTGRLQAVVVNRAGDIPIQFSGAGIWEALILSTFLAAPEGRILVLDEPALNLHPTLQRKALQMLKAGRGQSIVITHSPYLVPTDREEDLYRIVRFYLQEGSTRVTRLHREPPPGLAKKEMAKWIKEMARTPDVPALLFSRAVILVEGETESGALSVWFAKSQTGKKFGSLEDRNLAVHWVGGDQNFGTYVAYLKAFAVPWVIICDGKVLGEGRVFKQIGVKTPGPDAHARFEDLKKSGKKYGVFTLAQEASEEFESLPFVEPHLEKAGHEVGASKVRRGRHIAYHVPCPDAVNSLYAEILKYLGENVETST